MRHDFFSPSNIFFGQTCCSRLYRMAVDVDQSLFSYLFICSKCMASLMRETEKKQQAILVHHLCFIEKENQVLHRTRLKHFFFCVLISIKFWY